MSSSEGGASCATLLNRWLHEYHVLDDPSVDDATYDRAFDELVELEQARAGVDHRRLADAAGRRAGVVTVPEGRAPDARWGRSRR